ncbi:MAG: IS1595 family transposase, partial [Candidatus Thermoplasmatota archaeon]|nr:IS1595 family transposase [Candidatus Thermoplasmatota archaeon]
MPEPGKDYPRNWKEFMDWFSDEEKCYEYLEKIRWNDGFICHSCNIKQEPYKTTRGRITCRSCLHQTSVTAGTIFHGTRTPLRLWFSAIWYVVNQKNGTNALGLQRVLGFKSYQTAWAMLHKLRRVMIRPHREKLSGIIEVDEFYIGKKEDEKKGRLVENKSIVIVAVEMNNKKGLGRVRLRQIKNVSEDSLIPFINDVVEKGSTIKTDGWVGYYNVEKNGFIHDVTIISSSNNPAHVSMPGVHLIASLVK